MGDRGLRRANRETLKANLLNPNAGYYTFNPRVELDTFGRRKVNFDAGAVDVRDESGGQACISGSSSPLKQN